MIGAALLAVPLGLAGGGLAAEISSPLAEVPEDTETYAKTYGVSIEEAKARLATMDVARVLQAELRANESSVFGGLWIDHEPEFAVVVNVLAGGESGILKSVEALGLSGVTRMVTAQYTEDELQSDQTDAVTKLPMTMNYATGINLRANRVEVYVEGADDVATLEDANFAESVVVVERLLPTPQVAIYGGLSISNGCTTGFSVQKNGTSTEGVTTAGHCGNAATYAGVALTFIDEQVANRVDAQWYTTPGGLTDPNLIRVASDGTTRAMTSRRTRSEMMVGDHVCHYGRTSHYGCGNIDDVSWGSNMCVPGSAPPDNTYIYVNNSGAADVGEPGDSGGPWFLNNRAWGTHVCGEDGADDDKDGIFMAQNFLSTFDIVVDIS